MTDQTLENLATLHSNILWKLSLFEKYHKTPLDFQADEPQVNYRFMTSFFLRKLMWADGLVHPEEVKLLREVLGEEMSWAQEVMIQTQVAEAIQRDSQLAPTLRASYHDYMSHVRVLYRLKLLGEGAQGKPDLRGEQLDLCAPLVLLAAAGKRLILSDQHIARAELAVFNAGIGAMCDALEARGGSLSHAGTSRDELLIGATDDGQLAS